MGRLAGSGGAQLAATTPASAGLVLNSLAYQVLLRIAAGFSAEKVAPVG